MRRRDEARGGMARERLLGVKAVIDALGVSRTTFWRARASGIEGLPAPILIGGRLHWKASDLERLGDAMLQYQGRCVFEQRPKPALDPVLHPLKRRRRQQRERQDRQS